MKLKDIGMLGALSISAYAGGNVTVPLKAVVEIPKQEIAVLNNNYFVYVAGGFSVLDVEAALAPNTTFLNGALDDKGGAVEIGAGYRYSENIFVTIAAQRTMLDIADIDNFYGSINYQFTEVTAKPYIGALVGYSQLEWSEFPHTRLINDDLTSDGLMYGLQTGVEYKVFEFWSIFAKYQFIVNDHMMDIRINSSSIQHNYAQNLLLGGRYEF